MSVLVCWLDDGEVAGPFCESILNLVTVGSLNGIVKAWSRLETGPVLDKARNDISERFLDSPNEWMLMVDSDMTFTPGLLDRLLEIADPEERPIVAPLCYSVNQDGPFPVIFQRRRDTFAMVGNPPMNQLVKVDGVGTGCVLIHRTVFDRITGLGLPGRWFDHLMLGEHPLGEDLSFCVRAALAGIPIWVDTGLEIGHVKWRQIVVRNSFETFRRTNRFLITGTGRCGTGYVAAVLNACQVPCGHETVYRPDGPGDWGNVRADSSWMAAPHLKGFKGTIVHLLRNPLHVVNSLLGIGFFNPEIDHGKYREYARRYCPQAFQTDDPILAAATFVVEWNRMITPYADLTFRVEELKAEDIHGLLHRQGGTPSLPFVTKKMATVPLDVNHRSRAEYGWDRMPAFLVEHGMELGYGVPATRPQAQD